MTKEELQQMLKDAADAAVKGVLEAQTKQAADAEAAKAEAAKQATATPEQPAQAPETKQAIKAARSFGITSSDREPQKGEVLGRLVRSLVACKFDADRALREVKAGKFGNESKIIEGVERAMAAGSADAGGYLLPSEMADDVIEMLYATTVVRRAGPIIMPMPTGTITVPKITSSMTAQYVGEGAAPDVSNAGTRQVVMTYKKLVGLVPVSNDLLLFGGAKADMIIRNDMVRSASVREDVAFLRGTASEHTPRGLRYWAPAANVTATNGTDLASVRADLQELTDALQGANVPMINPCIFCAPRTRNHLRWNVTDGNGNLVFADEIAKGMLGDFHLFATTSIPTNLGVGANESELVVADMADAMIGESGQVIIDASNQSAYTDENGDVQSSFGNDQTVFKIVLRHDFSVRRDAAVAVKTGILYGT